MIYFLLDLKRRKMGIKQLVYIIEKTTQATLADYGIFSVCRTDAPGVYVNGAKIASLGLRVKNGLTYHGLSLNVDMDLSPFQNINPCGYKGLSMTQMKDCQPDPKKSLSLLAVGEAFVAHLAQQLNGQDA